MNNFSFYLKIRMNIAMNNGGGNLFRDWTTQFHLEDIKTRLLTNGVNSSTGYSRTSVI